MIKDYVARAMQISMLEQDQIERLHVLEKACNHLLANWNIQSLFALPEIKYKYDIPDDADKQQSHHRRIEQDIERLELMKTGKFYEDSIDKTHAQDWNFFNAKNQIVWSYQGPGSKKASLKEMLRGSMSLLAAIEFSRMIV